MPHISRVEKAYLSGTLPSGLEVLYPKRIKTVGQLTWMLYKVVLDYLWLAGEKSARYKDYAQIIAALDCAKEEFRRRKLNPYEDKAIEKNGEA